MKRPTHYKNYVGQYVKRFYAPFKKESIYKIKGFRVVEKFDIKDKPFLVDEFLYDNGIDESWWADCEDSCIITNESPIKNIDWVANVNHPEYKGYNPFNEEII